MRDCLNARSRMDRARPHHRGVRAAGDLRDHAARGGARLRRDALRRQDGVHARAHQPESAAAHRSGRHHRRAAGDPRHRLAAGRGGFLFGWAKPVPVNFTRCAIRSATCCGSPPPGPGANLVHGARLGARCSRSRSAAAVDPAAVPRSGRWRRPASSSTSCSWCSTCCRCCRSTAGASLVEPAARPARVTLLAPRAATASSSCSCCCSPACSAVIL